MSKSFSKIKLNRLFNSNCDENNVTSRIGNIARDLDRRNKRINAVLLDTCQKDTSLLGNNLQVDENKSVLNECLSLLEDQN